MPCVVYKWELCAQRHEPIKEDRETKSKGVTLGVPQGGPGAGSLAVLRHASVTFMLSTQKTPPSLRAPTGLSATSQLSSISGPVWWNELPAKVTHLLQQTTLQSPVESSP